MFFLTGEWINRKGFLFLPLCPLYGFALIGSRLMPAACQKTYFRLWLSGCVGGTLLEFTSSVLMEKAFHLRWWDYSYLPYNIEGRVWLPMSLLWGLVVVVSNRWLSTLILAGLKKLPVRTTEFIFTLLLVLVIIDSSLTSMGLFRFAQRHQLIQTPSWVAAFNQDIGIDDHQPWLIKLDQTLFSDQHIYRIFPYITSKDGDRWERMIIQENRKNQMPPSESLPDSSSPANVSSPERLD